MWGETYPGVPSDAYHPNDKGNTKMAKRLYEELVEELGHDALDDTRIGDEADDSHLASTSSAHERVHLVHSPDQIRPTTPQRRPLRRRRDGLW